MKIFYKTASLLLIVPFLCSCSMLNPKVPEATLGDPAFTSTRENTPLTASADATFTPTPFQPSDKSKLIYWSPEVPKEWIQSFANLTATDDPAQADLSLSVTPAQNGMEHFGSFQRVYAVGAPFPTVLDNLSLTQLKKIWMGKTDSNDTFSSLVMTEETKMVFTALWGEPDSSSVKTTWPDQLVTEVWNSTSALALIPFEDIVPRLKILNIDGINPLQRPMNAANYGLTVTFELSGKPGTAETLKEEIEAINAVLPATNREESKMAIVITTGTTALARVTLKKIELNGYDYPVEMVKDWFLNADLRHVSNEVSFREGCEYTDPYTMQFCSRPNQIKVLENLGINVVESTGNHLNDYDLGKSFTKTLKMYEERGWLNFGGGIDAEAAKQPAVTEVNGNKIAFIGCNPVGFETDWATDQNAGSAKCDYPWFYQKIAELKAQGYIVIATYQFTEIDRMMYDEYYRTTFKDAAKAGADIVQGSQSHVPMGMEFVNDSLIHYGLGNFLFDQMEPQNLPEFYDRHIMYNGKYINTQLLTATLTDWSRPVPMEEDDRQTFLQEIFNASHMR